MKLLLSAQCITALCFAFTPALAQSQTQVQPKHMYRWVDENGKVSFSDQVPPSKAELGHTELDKNAQVVKVAARAKTKAELEIYKRLMQLKKQQEQLNLKQKAHDKNLLSSFIDLAAMDTTHAAKIQVFNEQDRMLRETNKKLDDELAAKQQNAASYEIKNSKVPASVLDRIEDIQKKIIQVKQAANELQQKREKSEAEFTADRARFIFLTQSKNTSTAHGSGDKPANQPGLFSCDSSGQCEKAWIIAKEFVKANSTAKINVDTDTLFMTEDPVSNTDVNLSISKISIEGSKSQIFLDIRCANDALTNKSICSNSKVEEIRNKFNDYLKERLNTANSPPSSF